MTRIIDNANSILYRPSRYFYTVVSTEEVCLGRPHDSLAPLPFPLRRITVMDCDGESQSKYTLLQRGGISAGPGWASQSPADF